MGLLKNSLLLMCLAFVLGLAHEAMATVYTIEIDRPTLTDGAVIPDGHGAVAGVFDTTYYIENDLDGDGLDVDLHIGYDFLDGDDGATPGEGIGTGEFSIAQMDFVDGLYPTAASFEIGRYGGASAGKSIDAGFKVWNEAGDTVVYRQTNLLDISSGLITVTADASVLAGLAANPGGYLDFVWDGDGWFGADNFTADIVAGSPVPGAPSLLAPSNGATDQAVDVTLDWSDPVGYNDTPTFELYLDTDSDPSDQTPIDTGTVTEYTPSPDLSTNTQYWWYVVATDPNSGGTPVTYTSSNIWDFTVIADARAASEPDPVDGAYVVSRNNVELIWTADAGASQHHIYFGPDYASVNTAGDPNTLPGRGVQTPGNESYTVPERLDIGGTYFWRIDEVNGGDTVRGFVWSFDVTGSDPTTCEGILSLGFGSTVDFDNNCNFNLADLVALAGEWLSSYDMVDVSLLAQKWLDCDDPEDDNCKRPWLALAKTCMDTLINFGTDTYGPVHTPMFMSIINVNTLTSPEDPLNGFCPAFCENNLGNPVFYDACMRTEGRPCHGRLSPGGTNAWLDQPLIKAMYLCSQMTSDTTYSDAADAYMSYFMNNCRKTSGASIGMFYWGSHSYWNAFTESYDGDGIHEILTKHPDWTNMYRLNPSAVTTEINKIWERHVCNKTTGEHNRHDSGGCGLDFSFSGGSFAMAFSFMYSATGNPVYLDRAILIADRHWTNRNTSTNLVPEAPTTSRYDGNHCMTSVAGPHVSQLLRCYELTGDDHFRDIAIAYVKAYDRYGWDPAEHTYWGMLELDGTPVPGEKGGGGGYDVWAPKGYIDFWRTDMYPYELPLVAAQAAIYAYEQSDYGSGRDPALLTIALHWAEVAENNLPSYLGQWWKDEVENSMPDVIKTEGTYAENYGRAISFFIHLYRATQNMHYLDLAEALAVEAVEKLYTNGIFKGHPAKPYYQSNDGVGFLLWALLELDDPDVIRKGAF